MKVIKPYVDFGFKHPDRVKPKNKALITRYYKFLEPQLATHYGYRPKGLKAKSFQEARADINAEFLRAPRIKNLRLKVFLIPNDEPEFTLKKTKAGYVKHYRAKRRTADDEGDDTDSGPIAVGYRIPFSDRQALVTDPVGYVNSLVKNLPAHARLRPYNQHPGTFGRQGGRWDPATIAEAVSKYQGRYLDKIGGEFSV